MPWITFYAAIVKPSTILIWIVAFAWIYTLINLYQTYFFYCSPGSRSPAANRLHRGRARPH